MISDITYDAAILEYSSMTLMQESSKCESNNNSHGPNEKNRTFVCTFHHRKYNDTEKGKETHR